MQVFPATSMVSFCNGNATGIQPKLVNYEANIVNDNLEGAMSELKDSIKLLQGSIFNCFYTVFDPITAANIRKDFDLNVLLWNVLFNFGYFYSDLKDLFVFFTYQVPANKKDTRTWFSFGKYIADFAMRFLYTKYRT